MKNFRPSCPARSGTPPPIAAFFTVLASFLIATTIAAEDRVVVLKAARLFDGKSKTLVTNGVVVVQGDKIVDAGSNLPTPPEAQAIDVGDATLSPGFMDAHTHLTFDYSGNYNELRLRMLDENIPQLALEMIPNAKATIDAGFTSVRDLGSGYPNSHDFPDVSLRNAI